MGDDKTQFERFKAAAHQVEADEASDTLDRIMGKLDLKRKPEPEKKAKRDG